MYLCQCIIWAQTVASNESKGTVDKEKRFERVLVSEAGSASGCPGVLANSSVYFKPWSLLWHNHFPLLPPEAIVSLRCLCERFCSSLWGVLNGTWGESTEQYVSTASGSQRRLLAAKSIWQRSSATPLPIMTMVRSHSFSKHGGLTQRGVIPMLNAHMLNAHMLRKNIQHNFNMSFQHESQAYTN